MRFGLHLPHLGAPASSAVIRDWAQEAEALGFDSVWVSDHVASPERVASRYPYSDDGAWMLGPDAPWFDALGTLAFVAGATRRVRLGVSVLIVPYRPALVTAKCCATVDVLSHGRLVLGGGAGWMAEEFAALGAPFEERGPRTDDYLRAFRAAWAGAHSYRGPFVEFEGIGCRPLPEGPIPLWVGGTSAAALRRAGRLGDGWHALAVSPERMRASWQRVREHARAAGRDPDRLVLSVRMAERLPANPGAAAAFLRSYADAGAELAVLHLGLTGLTPRQFVEEVVPLLR